MQQQVIYKIKLTVGEKEYTASLPGTATAADFVQLLPLTVNLKDYAGTEKIFDIPEQLTVAGAPSGSTASAGDLAYYAPWGNMAIFYRNFRYSEGLVVLGKFHEDLGELKSIAKAIVTISRLQ